MKFRLSYHAKQELERRGISQAMVELILERPQQIVEEEEGIKVFQSQIDFGGGKMFLLRVFVAEEGDSSKVVTVYRTSKIRKYWRAP